MPLALFTPAARSSCSSCSSPAYTTSGSMYIGLTGADILTPLAQVRAADSACSHRSAWVSGAVQGG